MMYRSSCIYHAAGKNQRLLPFVLLLLTWLIPSALWAQAVEDASPTSDPQATDQVIASCKDQSPQQTWLDRFQETLGQMACTSAWWVDGLFNAQHQSFDYRSSYGELFTAATWSQQQEFDKVLRFRAHLHLPYARNRLHAFIGRVDRNEFVTESVRELHALPVAFDRNLKNSVLLGLGYEEPMKKRGAFDADIGMPFDWPADPFAKASYRIGFPLGDSDLVRVRDTVFWQKSEHFGTTVRVDWDHVISDNHLLRWTVSATNSQLSEGWRGYSTLTWYQMLNLKQAMAYELASHRSNRYTSKVIDDYGFTAIYRHNFWRTWLWLEVRAGVDWPYQELTDDRHSNLNALIGFEMRYGGRD